MRLLGAAAQQLLSGLLQEGAAGSVAVSAALPAAFGPHQHKEVLKDVFWPRCCSLLHLPLLLQPLPLQEHSSTPRSGCSAFSAPDAYSVDDECYEQCRPCLNGSSWWLLRALLQQLQARHMCCITLPQTAVETVVRAGDFLAVCGRLQVCMSVGSSIVPQLAFSPSAQSLLLG